jgi:hypothetical protein
MGGLADGLLGGEFVEAFVRVGFDGPKKLPLLDGLLDRLMGGLTDGLLGGEFVEAFVKLGV